VIGRDGPRQTLELLGAGSRRDDLRDAPGERLGFEILRLRQNQRVRHFHHARAIQLPPALAGELL